MPSKRPVTIRDVALRAGVSESTVSRVLSGTQTAIPFSEDTRRRVEKAARELAYRANPGAQLLRGKGTHLIGAIVSEIDDPFFSQLINELGNVAHSEGYDLMLGSARNDPAAALTLGETLNPRFCDGLFMLGDLQESEEDHGFLQAIRRQVPLILVCRGSGQLVDDYPSVSVDNRKGACLALEYLVRLGHQRIAFIGTDRLGDLKEREKAYVAFMEGQFGRVPVEYLRSADNSFAGGHGAMVELLHTPAPPTAVFAADDTMAIGAFKAAAAHGYRVPEDISIVGFDGIRIADYLHPRLTTVRQPVAEIARQAIDLFLLMLRNGLAFDVIPHLLLEPVLVEGNSCAPPCTDDNDP